MALLETRDLTRRFGGLTAVHRVTLQVEPGEVRAVIGPNGAGKTTLFNLITGALAPSAGRVLFRDRDITRLGPAETFRLGIVRSFQISQVFPRLSVRANLSLMVHGRARTSGRPLARSRLTADEVNGKVETLLERVHLSEHADRLAGELAHGDRRLLEIGMVVGADPELLLLDEPTAGMSPEETKQTALLLRGLAPAITLLIVEHDMSVVMSVSDRITVLHRGEILAEGTPDEIRADPAVQAVYLGPR